MCGLLGWIGHGPELRGEAERALDLLAHRGPDSEGLWIARDNPVALGGRRLAIIDRRPEADQPMSKGPLTIVHNGEIYNYVELRRELSSLGVEFETSSDTEVIIRAVEHWGDDAIARFNGMFACAFWDDRSGHLTLARDRFGEKPLFYAEGPNCFHFASEIKALLPFPCVRRAPDEAALYRFLAAGHVPDGTDRTFFDGIRQLRPATILKVGRDRPVATHRYWQLVPDADAADLPLDQAASRLAALLDESVRIRLRSDVPVGTSLSGGIDSSLIVATLARVRDVASPALRTFSARHEAAAVDEGRFIGLVTAAAGSEPHEVWIKASELPNDIERLVWHQDEPFWTTSMYAQWKVYELAGKNGIRVLLDGQGADEVFGGYHSLAFGASWSGLLRRLDLRNLIPEMREYRRQHDATYSWMLGAIAARSIPRWLDARTRPAYWRSAGLIAKLPRPTDREPKTECDALKGTLRRALCHALLSTSLPGLLRVADRSSMAHSVEVRLPFLDHRIVEFAFGLRERHLVQRGTSKRILRELLRPALPTIAERRDKIGFETPERAWFSGPLRGWMADLLGDASRRDLFRRGEVDRMWTSVLEGRTASQVAWRVAVVELWLRRYFDSVPVPPPPFLSA